MPWWSHWEREGHTTGFLLPANFTNLFTDRYSSDHGATHKSGSECKTGRKGGGKRLYICGRCALRADHARRRTSNGVENLFRSRLGGGVKAVVNMNASTCCELLPSFSSLLDHGELLLCPSRADFSRRSARNDKARIKINMWKWGKSRRQNWQWEWNNLRIY